MLSEVEASLPNIQVMAATENPAISKIVNAEIVIQHFGYWPSFHDATLETISFSVCSSKCTVTLLIETAEFTDELDGQGQYKQFRPCSVELQFKNVKDTFLTFDHTPILFEVDFEQADNGLDCSFSSSTGSHSIVAEHITVLSLTPTKQ